MAKNVRVEDVQEEIHEVAKEVTQAGLNPLQTPEASIAPVGFAEMTGGGVNQYDDSALFEQPDIQLSGGRFPTLRLASGQTKEVLEAQAHPGDWVLEGHESKRSVIFMPTRYFMARQLTEKLEGQSQIVCRAERVPVRKDAQPLFGVGVPGGLCAECPMSKWGERNPSTGKGTPPPCKLIHIFEGIDLSHEARVEIRLKSTGEKLANEIRTLVATRGMGQFLLELGHSREQTGQGIMYFQPRAKVIDATQEHREVAQRIHERERQAMGF